MAILEAQAAGLPVVAGRTGGVPELVAHERTGLLSAPGDPAGFAAATGLLLAAPERRRDYGRSALAKVAAEHDIAPAGAAVDRILQMLATVRA
jgi:glycosyltransferase involved in cell wall biosynthesis